MPTNSQDFSPVLAAPLQGGTSNALGGSSLLRSDLTVSPLKDRGQFIVRDGVTFAGTHLLIDLWGASHLDDLPRMERTLRETVRKCRAVMLHMHLHHFQPEGGITGVVVLAESHISVHTWPERSFAAFDLFMCGNSEPQQAIAIFEKAFKPERVVVKEYLRGITDAARGPLS